MIDLIKNEELKIKQEDLLKNMKMLRHTVADMLGSNSFLKGLKPGAQNGVITVYGEQFPIYVSSSTLAADGLSEITDDIYDEENYLSLVSDDDLMWYALVEHLGTKMENLWKENKELIDEKNQLKEKLTAANDEINELKESLKEANKKCTEYVKDIDKLTVDNHIFSERIKSLVTDNALAEKVSDPNEDIEIGDLDTGTPHLLNKITELENENKRLSDTATLLQENAKLKEEIQILKDSISERLKTHERQIYVLKKEKEEAELLAHRLTRGEMHVQFDNMKSLEHENGVLKKENADLNQKLYQKKDEDDLRKRISEYAQKNGDLLERNKILRQENTKLRVQLNSYSGVTVVNNEDIQQKITKEAMSELTARINELEEKLKDKDEYINQLSKNNNALSAENKNFGDLLKNADRDARFYAREADHLRQENDKIYSILNDVVQNRNE